MATKTSKLHTSFTGDDKQFQRTAGRVMKSGTQMGAMAGRLQGAFAAMGGAMVLSQVVEKFDRIGKVAKRVGMSAEEVQRLGHAAELAGTNFESLQGIMTRLQRRIGEALQNPASAAAQAFNELGLSAVALKEMGLKEQFFAVADAFKATGGGVEGTASLMKLLDTEVRNLIPLFQEGSIGIQSMMDSAVVASNKTVEALEKVSDQLTVIKNKGTAAAAEVLTTAITAWEKYSTFMSTAVLLGVEGFKRNVLGDEGALTPDEIIMGGKSVWTGKKPHIGDWMEPGFAGSMPFDERMTERDPAEIKREEMFKRAERFLGDVWQTRIGQAFGEKEEDPFAETIAALEEKWKPSELAKKKEEAEQKNLSGQFSEFLQTAGLGGTGYLRKTPEIVQLEKQTKISESMLQSLKDFNSSMGILVDNTVDR